jgi:hypothetical protein
MIHEALLNNPLSGPVVCLRAILYGDSGVAV